MADLPNTVAVQNITVPPITTMLDHLVSVDPHPQYVQLAELPTAVSNLVTLSNIRDVIVPNSSITDHVLAWKNAAWRPTAMSDIIDAEDLPGATTQTKGVVRLATKTDISNYDTSSVITPDEFRKYLNENGYTDAVTQKLQVARSKEQVIEAINASSTNMISGMELDGGANQYVLVSYPKSNVNNAISADTQYASARYPNVSRVLNQSFADIHVYKNGVVEDFIMKDELSSTTTDGIKRRPLSMVFYEDASGYDLAVKNSNFITVQNNAKINRIMVSSNGILYNYGTAHDIKLIGNAEGTDEAKMVVDQHGHAEYITISRGGRVEVYNGGIIEHVQATDTYAGANCAVQIASTGKAYHIVLNAANAIAYPGAYMEDVELYDGAFLTISSGAVIKDLKAYQNAHIELHDGAKIEGLVRYQPSVTFGGDAKDIPSIVSGGAICNPKKILIRQMNSNLISTNFHISYIQSGASYESAGISRDVEAVKYTWTTYKDGIASATAELADMPPANAFYPDIAPEVTNKVTNTSEFYNNRGELINTVATNSTYTTTEPGTRIVVPGFTAPKGFLRIMPEAVRRLESADADTLNESGTALYSSAYQYHVIDHIAGYRPMNDPDVVYYTVDPPENFLESFNADFEWYVTF